jgi:IS5 family transposase
VICLEVWKIWALAVLPCVIRWLKLAMRKRFDLQLQLGSTPIEQIGIPTTSRDELPPVLRGLQWIFTDPEVNEEIFALLEAKIVGDKKQTGRPGMDLWRILVLGVVRLALDCDYDRMEHIANYDSLVREMLGISAYGEKVTFHHRTISENICHIDDQLLEQINEIVVRHGHKVFKKKDGEQLAVKTDSFVVETNIHYPTDLHLLWDASRKCIELTRAMADDRGLEGWRKSKVWLRRIKNAYRASVQAKKGGGTHKEQRVGKAVRSYLELTRELDKKVSATLLEVAGMPSSILQVVREVEIEKYHKYLVKHVELVERRLLKGEVIPHEEKVFSLFEEHSEMIKKGKINPPVEFGHRLLISSDQYGLMIDYKVMFGGDEKAELLPLFSRLEKRFGMGLIRSMSTDKGFSSARNREELEGLVEYIVLPQAGKLSEADRQRESEKIWRKLKHHHSAIESDINSLEHHGQDRCPDKGYNGYTRYAGLGILALNLHRIGNQLQAIERARKKRPRRKAA